MSIVLKVVAIVVASVFAFCILGTIVFFGSNMYSYMNNKNFDFRTALNWAIEDYTNFINSINPFKATAEETIPFANQYINVLPCVNL